MKRRTKVENEILRVKEALNAARDRQDRLDVLGGTDEEKAAVAAKIKELEDKLKGNTTDPEPVAPEPKESSLDEKIAILKDNLNYLEGKKSLLSARIDDIIKSIRSTTTGEGKESLTKELEDLDKEVEEIRGKIISSKPLLQSLEKYKKRLDDIEKEIEERNKAVNEFMRQYRTAKELHKDSDMDFYAKKAKIEKDHIDLLEKEKESIIENIERYRVEPEQRVDEDDDEERRGSGIVAWIKKHLRFFIAIAAMIVMIIVLVIVMKNCVGNNKEITPTVPATTVSTTAPTTKPTEPTTTKPTEATTEPTTKATEPVVEEYDSYYSDDSNYYEEYYDNNSNDSDYYEEVVEKVEKEKKSTSSGGSMSSSKDSKKDEGKTGGNKGYGASTSSSKASPQPEKIFEEENPLPPTVSQEEIDNSPTVPLTPRSTADNSAE